MRSVFSAASAGNVIRPFAKCSPGGSSTPFSMRELISRADSASRSTCVEAPGDVQVKRITVVERKTEFPWDTSSSISYP